MGADAAVLVFALFFQRAALIDEVREEVVDVTLTLELQELVVEEGAAVYVYLLEMSLEMQGGVGEEIAAADGDELPGDGDEDLEEEDQCVDELVLPH